MRLGIIKKQRTRSFELDTTLQTRLINLAEKQHRSPGEIHAEVVEVGFAKIDKDSEWIKCWENLSPRKQDGATNFLPGNFQTSETARTLTLVFRRYQRSAVNGDPSTDHQWQEYIPHLADDIELASSEGQTGQEVPSQIGDGGVIRYIEMDCAQSIAGADSFGVDVV
jgi:hypothetical protein